MLMRYSGVLLIALLLGSAQASAQTWPTKSLRVYNGYSPGASVDLTCRVALNALSTILGQPVVIENRPGNASILGAQAAARADADGYNYFCSATSSIVTNPLTFKKLPYDPEKDFTPVGMVGTNPFYILVNPQVPAKTLPELIALDKANPGTLSFASDGTKNFTGLIGTWLNKLGGTKFVQVPYSAMAQGLQDTIAGRTQIVMQPAATARQYIANGQLRPIAVTSLQPTEGLESVPPVAATFPDFEFVGWVGIFAPTGTPDAMVRLLNRALGVAVRDSAVVERLQALGMTASKPGSPQQMAAFIKGERERWTHLMREIHFEPD
jgi:tripartite-type tricarboxylate transporter receptor subunit TctC